MEFAREKYRRFPFYTQRVLVPVQERPILASIVSDGFCGDVRENPMCAMMSVQHKPENGRHH
jgi:hypothetical protein